VNKPFIFGGNQMKRLLAIVLAVFLLSAVVFPVGVSAAYEEPPELAEIAAATNAPAAQWPLPANSYYPELDNQGIPAGAYVYNAYTMDPVTYAGTPIDKPASITGYTEVSSMADLVPGTWYYADVVGYNYIFVMDAAADGAAVDVATPGDDVAVAGDGSALPAELANAFPVGVWGVTTSDGDGAHDPSLDGLGIPEGANVFGLFDAAYAPIDAPASITGYTAVGSVADVVPGTYFIIEGQFGYVVIAGADGPFDAAPPVPPAGGGDVDTPAEPAPPAAAAEVYVTVVNAGVVEVAAEPIIPDKMTFESVIIKAHELFYKDGVSGYDAGIDASYNMFLISKTWGVPSTPFTSQGDGMLQSTADTAPVNPGDNIIITVGGAPSAVTLKAMEGENAGEILITATSWVLDFSTFTYMSSKVADGRLTDRDGNELGVTGGDGTAVITVPADEGWDGTVILEGMAAINVLASMSAPPDPLDANARTVYVTVKLDSGLVSNATAVGVKVTNNVEVGEQRTVDGMLKHFHSLYFNNGENGIDGYATGSKIWGVEWKDRGLIRPKLALNDELLDLSSQEDLNRMVRPDDNFLISISTNAQQEPIAVYMDIYINGTIAFGDAYFLEYGDNGSTSKRPVGAGYALYDAETPAAPLGAPNTNVLATAGESVVTDENGHFEVNVPTAGRVGIVVMQNLAAINTIYSAAYPVFKGPDGILTLQLLVIGVGGAIPLGIVVAYAMHIEIKNRGVKRTKTKLTRVAPGR
jgi:hypothetical protein